MRRLFKFGGVVAVVIVLATPVHALPANGRDRVWFGNRVVRTITHYIHTLGDMLIDPKP